MTHAATPAEDSTALRRAVIDTARAMNAAGINVNKAGNVSVRCTRGRHEGLLITPTGLGYDRLQPTDLAFIRLADGAARGDRAPSSEWRFHLDICRRRPELAAIVHTHSPFATAFAVGMVLLATTTLLPPFLQGLMDYPVFDTGLLLAPRGVGTALAMIVCGRLGDRVDPRATILLGLALTALSLHAMTGFDTTVDRWAIVWTGTVQGLGIGFVFPPLTAVTFASLAARHRNEGTALFSLVRNIGSSLGISIVVSALSRNTRIEHAALAASTQASELPMRLALESGAWRIDVPEGLAAIDAEIVRQAATIAYLQDFRLMAWVCVATMPLVLLLRAPGRSGAVPAVR